MIKAYAQTRRAYSNNNSHVCISIDGRQRVLLTARVNSRIINYVFRVININERQDVAYIRTINIGGGVRKTENSRSLGRVSIRVSKLLLTRNTENFTVLPECDKSVYLVPKMF